MNYVIATIAGIFAIFFFASRKTNTDKEDRGINILNTKIESNEKLSTEKEKSADEQYKEYMDALKKYDPDFHNDDGSGHSN